MHVKPIVKIISTANKTGINGLKMTVQYESTHNFLNVTLEKNCSKRFHINTAVSSCS